MGKKCLAILVLCAMLLSVMPMFSITASADAGLPDVPNLCWNADGSITADAVPGACKFLVKVYYDKEHDGNFVYGGSMSPAGDGAAKYFDNGKMTLPRSYVEAIIKFSCDYENCYYYFTFELHGKDYTLLTNETATNKKLLYEKGKLQTPSGMKASGSVVSWNPVNGATEYEVRLVEVGEKGDTFIGLYTVYEASMDVSKYVLESGNYKIQVGAMDSTITYAQSDRSGDSPLIVVTESKCYLPNLKWNDDGTITSDRFTTSYNLPTRCIVTLYCDETGNGSLTKKESIAVPMEKSTVNISKEDVDKLLTSEEYTKGWYCFGCTPCNGEVELSLETFTDKKLMFDKGSLKTPSNFKIVDSLISWDEVANADLYLVKLYRYDDGGYKYLKEIQINDAYFDVADEVTVEGQYAIEVGAVDTTRAYGSSAISDKSDLVTINEIVARYEVSVKNGKATVRKSPEGKTVSIKADAPATGKEFDKWVVVEGKVTFKDATKAETTFVMPGEKVTVEATYRDKTDDNAKFKTVKPKIVKLTKAKKSFKIKWKKVSGASGYQVQYSTSKKFTKKTTKKVTYKGNKKFAKTVKKLKSGKKYYVKIRAYKTVNGSKVYSKWSKVKTIKTK